MRKCEAFDEVNEECGMRNVELLLASGLWLLATEDST